MIQAKFGLNWPSGFRGEDFLKSLQTDDGRPVMAIAHMTLWVRWVKKLAYQKQELPVVAMFVNGSGHNVQF
jgi:hypothetical protein